MIDSIDGLISAGYTVIRKLGTGLYATCYLCKHNYYGLVVLKEYDPVIYLKNESKNHYEATILSTFDHPSIPKVFGMLRIKEHMYLVLEYLQGNTLNMLLFKKCKRFKKLEVIEVYTQLISVISYIHKHHIVHRDISIDNVLYDEKKIALIDFGLSRPIRYEDNAKQRDYYCLGEILLFMLYSRHKKNSNQNSKLLPWYQELRLTKMQKKYIAKLLGLDIQYQCIEDISKDFIDFFINNNRQSICAH